MPVSVADAYLEHADRQRTRLDRPVSLGRSSSCDVPLNDTECSRRHALVNPQMGGEAWVVDLGSTNGTYVNGRRILRPTRLADGDRLTIGRSEFTFHGPSAARAAPAAASGETQLTQPVIKVERAWLLLADIEGFTEFSQQHPPEEVSRRVGAWVAACAARFAEHEADIQVFLGDGFLAYFPVKQTAPARFFAVFAGLRALQRDPAHLPFRIVLHHADISLGAPVANAAESILGPGVNLLFRLEKVASAARVRCAATAAALAHWPEPRPPHTSLGRHALKGFDGEHELFALA